MNNHQQYGFHDSCGWRQTLEHFEHIDQFKKLQQISHILVLHWQCLLCEAAGEQMTFRGSHSWTFISCNLLKGNGDIHNTRISFVNSFPFHGNKAVNMSVNSWNTLHQCSSNACICSKQDYICFSPIAQTKLFIYTSVCTKWSLKDAAFLPKLGFLKAKLQLKPLWELGVTDVHPAYCVSSAGSLGEGRVHSGKSPVHWRVDIYIQKTIHTYGHFTVT